MDIEWLQDMTDAIDRENIIAEQREQKQLDEEQAKTIR